MRGMASDPASVPPTPANCGSCGKEARLRRGRCPTCYERWLMARPVGVGAACASCGDRRIVHLRHFELHGMWVVLCHNCAARARALPSLPRSMDGLLAKLERDRRHTERRRLSPSESGWYEAVERRRLGRRAAERGGDGDELLLDASELVVELEADPPLAFELADPDEGSITNVHRKLDPAEI